MGQVQGQEHASQGCDVVDFDAVLLNACAPDIRADLLREAQLLAGVFAPDGDTDKVLAMAEQLNSGARDNEMGRAHARRLAAALKRIATEEPPPEI